MKPGVGTPSSNCSAASGEGENFSGLFSLAAIIVTSVRISRFSAARATSNSTAPRVASRSNSPTSLICAASSARSLPGGNPSPAASAASSSSWSAAGAAAAGAVNGTGAATGAGAGAGVRAGVCAAPRPMIIVSDSGSAAG